MGSPKADQSAAFNNLVFWNAVRTHPQVDPEFAQAQDLGLDTTQMLRTHQLGVELYASLMKLSVGQVDNEISEAAMVYSEARETAKYEWELLMVAYNGDLKVAAQTALKRGWLTAYATSGGMSSAQALAQLTLCV